MIRHGDNSGVVIARSISMLKEMPHPYPIFADLLRFFACIDYKDNPDVLIEMVGRYLLANLKGGQAQNYSTKQRGTKTVKSFPLSD